MKSILFVLVSYFHAGGAEPVAVYASLEQCEAARTVAAGNLAADYACKSAPVSGQWARRETRTLAALGGAL